MIVTFFNQTLNENAAVPENVTVVKRYGKRLVLDTAAYTEEELYTLFDSGAIMHIEPDLVAMSSVFELSGWSLNESEPYGLHMEALRRRANGSATLAVLDSGLPSVAQAYFKPEGGYSLVTMDQEVRGPDFTDRGGCVRPSWHGTQVLSVLDAVAPVSTKVILRVLDSCGVGFASDVADAVVWAAGGRINGLHLNPNPANVISMSFSGEGICPSYLQSAVTQAVGLGVVLVAAAGNHASDARAYFPGNCQGVKAVGAVTRAGTFANYSNYGPGLAFVAPGGDARDPIQVLSLSRDGLRLGYATAFGTSMAAPHVAGVYALLFASDAPVADVRAFLPTIDRVGMIAGESNHTINFTETVATFDNQQVYSASLCYDTFFWSGTWLGCYNSRTCPANSHWTASYLDCFCDSNYVMTVDAITQKPSCAPCPAGYWCLDGVKYACPAGTYSNAGASACTQCGAGTYSFSDASPCIGCEMGSYSTGTGARDANLCVGCLPGTFTAIKGATVCDLCTPGTASNGYNTRGACSKCQPQVNFAPVAGAMTCTPCSSPLCDIGYFSKCTEDTDSVCVACNPIARCTYTISGRCFMSDNSPACVCEAGYEMVAGLCQLCPVGKYKSTADYTRCTAWTVTMCPQQGTYLVQGSPFDNSACFECPELPSNSVRTIGGCSWGCEAGFDNNQPM